MTIAVDLGRKAANKQINKTNKQKSNRKYAIKYNMMVLFFNGKHSVIKMKLIRQLITLVRKKKCQSDFPDNFDTMIFIIFQNDCLLGD